MGGQINRKQRGQNEPLTPQQEVEFICRVFGYEPTDKERRTMEMMAEFDNQRIEAEFGGMY